MQTKKDIVKERLLEAAKKEFMEKGYDKASIRVIVKNADTTIGNFYNYFESKEAIFSELVDELHDAFIYFIDNHKDMEADRRIYNLQNIELIRELTAKASKQLLPFMDERLILLLDKSRGTKYENSKQELISVLKHHFLEHIRKETDYKLLQMGEVIAVQLVEGLLNIANNTHDIKIREELFVELILYNVIGILGLFNGGDND